MEGVSNNTTDLISTKSQSSAADPIGTCAFIHIDLFEQFAERVSVDRDEERRGRDGLRGDKFL